MSLSFIHLFVIACAVWRLSSLIANERGPFYIFLKIRNKAAKWNGEVPLFKAFHLWEMLTCEWCVSVWIGAAFVVSWWLLGDVFVMIALPFFFSTWAIIFKYIVQYMEKKLELIEISINLEKEGGGIHAVQDSHQERPLREYVEGARVG